jgi:hypothetical protein
MAFTAEQAAEFLDLLERFSNADAAEWLLTNEDEGAYVYCFVADERIDFVVHGGERGDEAIPVSSGEIAAVSGRWRHHLLLFLAPDEMHPKLVPLLRRAVPDLKRWQELSRRATRHALDTLHHASPEKAGSGGPEL